MTTDLFQFVLDTLNYNLFFYSSCGIFSALVTCIFIIRSLKRWGLTHRSNSFWGFVSGVLRIYSVFVMSIVGLCIGTLLGVNMTINDVITMGIDVSIQEVLAQSDSLLVSILAYFATDFVDGYFWGVYVTILTTGVLGFLKIPLADMVIACIYNNLRGRSIALSHNIV